MSATAIRRFDLYDFFSVLLPGVAMLLGFYPLYPQQFRISAIGAILPLLASGFVVGRAIHTGAVRIEKRVGVKSHRDEFVREINSPALLDEKVVDQFYSECSEVLTEFGDEDGNGGFDTSDDAVAASVYTTVRSYVHIDSRGRSRTFQAVYAFYRSMWFVSIALALGYLGYGILALFPAVTLPFAPKIALLSIPPAWFVIGSIALFAGSYTTFRDAKQTYRELFVEYLIADFIALRDGQ